MKYIIARHLWHLYREEQDAIRIYAWKSKLHEGLGEVLWGKKSMLKIRLVWWIGNSRFKSLKMWENVLGPFKFSVARGKSGVKELEDGPCRVL